MEIEDAKANLTSTVKDILCKAKESNKNFEQSPSRTSNANTLIIEEDSKDFKTAIENGGEVIRLNKEDSKSSGENDSFYDEVFYDVIPEEAFVVTEANAPSVEPEFRTALPVQRNKNKISFWVMLKDMIGKDLTKMSLPVYFNEPAGLLQRTAEAFENDYLLEKADKEKDPYLRLAYVAAFNASQYNGCLGRDMKPFNPLLGETFEYVTGSYKYFSEQVSHHPPISACHCESNNYIVYFNTRVTNKFWGNCIEFRPLGRMNIHLKTINEDYVINRPSINGQNIIFGKLYLDLSGESVAENIKTGDKCIIKFHTKGWSESSLGNMDGYVISKTGEKILKIEGKWCNSITAKNLRTGDIIPIWKKFPLPRDWENYYCFTTHALQLNYLPERLRKVLPYTDTRFRPDQRAYENGDIKLATQEKARLEERQRATRREMEKKKITYKPVYFTLSINPVTNDHDYIFNGKYWIDRGSSNWNHLQDIYGIKR